MMDELIARHAASLRKIYDERTAGDYTFTGVLAEFLRDYEQTKWTGFIKKYVDTDVKHTAQLANIPRSTMCACGDYFATSPRDLDDHVSAMMHVNDGKHHG